MKCGANWLKHGKAAAFAGFDEAEDGAEHIMAGFVPEAAGHLLAVFEYAKITLAQVSKNP